MLPRRSEVNVLAIQTRAPSRAASSMARGGVGRGGGGGGGGGGWGGGGEGGGGGGWGGGGGGWGGGGLGWGGGGRPRSERPSKSRRARQSALLDQPFAGGAASDRGQFPSAPSLLPKPR